MADIFISYRRDDTRWSAGRINDHLVAAFGSQRVFFDAITIEPGADFHEVIGSSVSECRVLLAIIGPGWLRTLDDRAGAHGDFVSVEIAEALRRGVRVVPLLIDGAPPPTEDMLPSELKPLARRHALAITSERCSSELERLVRFLKSYLGEPAPQSVGPTSPGYGGKSRCAQPRNISPQYGQEPFRHAREAPEMVVVPAGSFTMGAPSDQKGGLEEEQPRHEVFVTQPFLVGRCAVTVAEFDAFVQATGYAIPDRMFTCEADVWRERERRSYRSPGFEQSSRHPAVGISWHDAVAYCAWLSSLTGRGYRLMSEAEWEYCCRAGTSTPFAWGPGIVSSQANYDAASSRDLARPRGTVRVDAFLPNAWGLHQMHGNIWEWCEDHWHDSYEGAPCDGSAWEDDGSDLRVVRGGSWMSVAPLLQSSVRNKERPTTRMTTIGFRVARSLGEGDCGARHDTGDSAV